ncbi:Retrovirus-related Pol polyprotein [Thelohanellus kitauei]|uniref:Retrovirus-related Pol polyprotein n=1 Tax=Thelohanellus kitauei TaxID=669202 RepID=A0A0C2IDY5_THEKT|nr:Retrovirus-related Pol polyprotein [Thelohanellus kitauei]
MGILKTIDTIRKLFFWPHMNEEIEEYVKNCSSCCVNKSKNYTPRAELIPIVATRPFEFWAVDITGPLNTTPRGNRYIVVFVDHFTKWVEAVPITDQTAEIVAEAMLNHVVFRFGVPTQLHSDRGRQFESALFNHLCEFLGTQHTHTTAYHPMGNGLAERCNKTLKELLRHHLNIESNDWDLHLGEALFALRSTKNETTGYSPAMLCYGRELRLPIECMIQPQRSNHDCNYHIYVKRMADNINEIFSTAREHGTIMRNRFKINHDIKVFGKPYREGEKVFLKRKNRNKLDPIFDGPFIIIKSSHPVYTIEDLLGSDSQRVHFNRLFKGPPTNHEPIPNIFEPRRSNRIRRPPPRYCA